jgi:hypothetical protein
MNELVTLNCQKVASKFMCILCDYKTDKKSSYDKHLHTKKHLVTACDENVVKVARYKCKNCNKSYNSRNGLWVHNKNCNINDTINVNNIDNIIYEKDTINDMSIDKEDLILLLVKQNAELIKEHIDIKNMMIEQQNMMIKVIENGTHNTNITNTNTNSHNKAFNLNFFLNETCKDAMNINDFVDSIKLQLSDLEKVGELGYVEGISNIIIKNLNALDETKRPLHCTDKKRETIYIKDQGQWEKEDDNKTKLKKAINKIAHKNIKLITQFREKYPECKKSEYRFSDKYNKMVIEAMGGAGNNISEKEEKIIRNITKATTISQK